MKKKRRLRRAVGARLNQAVQSRFVVRWHMFAILLAVVAAGMLSSAVLYAAGLRSMPLRWGLSVLVGYAFFFLCVHLWTRFVRARFEERPPSSSALLDVALDVVDGVEPLPAEATRMRAARAQAPVPMRGRPGKEKKGSGIFGDLAAGGAGGDGGGAGVVVVIALALLVGTVLAAGTVLIVQAPLILTEVGAQVLLVEALRRRARKIETPAWTLSVFEKTVGPASAVLVVAVLAGAAIEWACPGAHTAAQALRICVF